ncbi:MAG: autorepressor SdpR family transcription factor [Spirosomataceae bacterium]
MNTLFRALNDPTRRQILELLREGDLTAGDIADQFAMSKPSISHHLDLLKQAELVDADKRGQFIYYSLNTTVLDELLTWLFTFKNHEKTLNYLIWAVILAPLLYLAMVWNQLPEIVPTHFWARRKT